MNQIDPLRKLLARLEHIKIESGPPWDHVCAVGSETALVVVWVSVRPINVLVNALSTLTLRLVSAVSLI